MPKLKLNPKLKFTPLQIITHIGAWIPLAWLLVDNYTNHLTINPIQAATQRTGKIALVLLVLSLAVTPINTLFGVRQVLKVRRALGLYAFMYAAIHLYIFSVLDYGLDWGLLQGAVLERPFVLIGLAALIILLALAATSFKYWMKRMGQGWKRLHKLVYLAGGLVVIHFALAMKGDILRLQGNVFQPLIYALLVASLLILRIPAIRKWAANTRVRLTQRKPVTHARQRRIA